MTTLPRYLGYNMPAVCIQFDDSLASHYTEAFAYMNPLGMKATCYIISPPFQNLTDEQMIEMDAAGWDMANHTTTPVQLDTLTLEEQTTAISSQKTLLDGLGLTRASSHVTYPSGAYNADTLTAMTNLGMLTGVTNGVQSRKKMYYHAANPLLWMTYSYLPTMTDEFFIDYLQAAQKSKQVARIVFHDIVASGATGIQCNRANFRAIIDWIFTSGMPVLTVTQMYSLLSGEINV